MEKLSNLRNSVSSFKSVKEQVINFACSSTGLPKEVVTQIYESQKLDLVPDQDIANYFTSLTQAKTQISSNDLTEALKTIFSEVDGDKKNLLVERFIVLLNDVSNPNNKEHLDSVNLISLIRDIVISVKPEAANELSNVLSISNLTENDFKSLNESFQYMNNVSVEDNHIAKLFESMKDVLYKNNRRWGNNNVLDNSYTALMDYISSSIEDIQLNSEIYHIDKVNHLELINQFLSGDVNPLYRNFSSAKTQIRDVQTTVFDMMLIVARYIYGRQDDLQYISRNTTNKFQKDFNGIVPMFYSSFKESKILNDTFVRELFINNRTVSDLGTLSDGDLATQLAKNVDTNKLNYLNSNLDSVSLRGVIEMVNFIDSSSFDFNLKIRPYLRNFVNSSRELLSKVEKARIMKSKYNGNII